MVGRRSVTLFVGVVVLVAMGATADVAVARDPGTPAADATVYEPAFADVPGDHTFASPVRALFAAGITAGCNAGSTRFCPDQPVTRGQMAAFLTRALDLTEDGAHDFTDAVGHRFADDVQKIAAAGITLGCNPPANDRFCPDQPVTRGQMAAFLSRALRLPIPPAVPDGVRLDRTDTDGVVGTRVSVCREVGMSLVIRSLIGGMSSPTRVMSWEPSIVDATAGETHLAHDLWFLPAGTGCETLELIWDPRANDLTPPLASLEITSPFGYRRSPTTGETRLHAGVDLDGETGDPVLAAAAGVVSFAGRNAELGLTVDVEHAGGLRTRYAHLSSIEVSVGDSVSSGETVGAVGCTGSCTGSHLHFGTFEFGAPVDPLSYLGG